MSPAAGSSRERPKQHRLRAPVRRERILEAALRVFGAGGYDASMEDVAVAAGITRTVLYYYFPSKQDLFLALLDDQAAAQVARLTPIVAGQGSQEERLRAFLGAGLAFAEEQPLAWDLIFGRSASEPTEVRAARRRVLEASTAALFSLIRPELDRAGFDPQGLQGQVVAEGALGAVIAMVAWWRQHPSVPRAELTEAAFEFFWRGPRNIMLAAETPPEAPRADRRRSGREK